MVTIGIAARTPYDMCIENGLLASLGERLKEVVSPPCAVAVIADDVVDALYGAKADKALESAGFRVVRHVFPHGEFQKNVDNWQNILCFFAEKEITRTDVVVALGGGVTGDMAGFAAATYLRGVRYVQVPTTLLAMVDSSVGGKTGINLSHGKNLVGAFHQPMAVFCDPMTLHSLPRDILIDGVAEAIKMGVLADKSLLDMLIPGNYFRRLDEIIAHCVRVKARLVQEDERDHGNRQLLNYGHTIGHAIEKRSGYAISHGRAVAMGMVHAARLAVGLGVCEEACMLQIMKIIDKNGLATASPYGPQELWSVIAKDKKRAGEKLTFVLPKAIGKCELYTFSMEELEKILPMAWK